MVLPEKLRRKPDRQKLLTPSLYMTQLDIWAVRPLVRLSGCKGQDGGLMRRFFWRNEAEASGDRVQDRVGPRQPKRQILRH